MTWRWTQRPHARRAVTHTARRPWLEPLEERGSPSVLPFTGLSDLFPERPPLAPENVRREEPWGLTAAPGDDGGPAVGAPGQSPAPAGDPVPIWLAGSPASDLLPAVMQSGASAGATKSPVIVEFYAREGADGVWTFEGRVEAARPEGLVVFLGGLPSLQGQTADVGDGGRFSFVIQLRDCESGVATAQTVDWDGLWSDVVEDVVHRTGCAE